METTDGHLPAGPGGGAERQDALDPRTRDIPLSQLVRAVRPAGGGTLIAPPLADIGRIAEAARWITTMGESAPRVEEAAALATASGFEIFRDRLGTDGGAVWVLRELPEVGRGGGLFVFRLSGAALVVGGTAPGQPDDAAALDAARLVFEEAPAFALVVDAGALAADPLNPPRPEAPPIAFYDAVHRETLRALRNAAYVQIRALPADEADRLSVRAIVGKGDAASVEDPLLDRLRDRLRALLGAAAVAVAGRDVDDPRAALDPRGRYVNAYSDDRFYRIDLAGEAAHALLASPESSRAFVDAVGGLVAE